MNRNTAQLFKTTTLTNQISSFFCHCYQKKELGRLRTTQCIETLSSNLTIKRLFFLSCLSAWPTLPQYFSLWPTFPVYLPSLSLFQSSNFDHILFHWPISKTWHSGKMTHSSKITINNLTRLWAYTMHFSPALSIYLRWIVMPFSKKLLLL